MRKLFKAAVVICLGAGFGVAGLGVAHAQGTTFRVSATSANPGAEIVMWSVTPCISPSGVQGSPIVRATLTRGSVTIGSGGGPVLSGGAWKASLTVDNDATPGPAQISVTCFASTQAEGALVNYDPTAFTVTGALPRTGVGSNVLAGTGFAFGLAGFGLMMSARRTRTIN